MTSENSLEYAQQLDAQDPLQSYKNQFLFPKIKGKDVLYFAGNSLGLQPKTAASFVDEVMKDWAELAVEGHFYADKPWVDYHERLATPLSKVVGAKPTEVTVMNTLTVNLHLLMVSFYRPQGKRYKIICEEKAFPSDQYMLQSQVRFHGYDPENAIVELKKREGEHTFRMEDVVNQIKALGEECALVLIGGVNYYSGQVFDIKKITEVAHDIGAFVGWDLAHAVGNVSLDLHDWDVDFAAWCSYKYMNSGPGNASGCFIHERYHQDANIPRFEGWWGTEKASRFLMKPTFEPMSHADAWQLSNPPILSLAPYLASLEQFDAIGMEKLVQKRERIVAYLEQTLTEVAKVTQSRFKIITPPPPERGTQLSILLDPAYGRAVFEYLMKHGVVLDWREPNVIRLAPVALYCSYEDIYQFGQLFKESIITSRNTSSSNA